MYYQKQVDRGSKSQMCLHKILSIITTINPPPQATAKEPPPHDDGDIQRPRFESIEGSRDRAEKEKLFKHSENTEHAADNSFDLLIQAADMVFGAGNDNGKPEPETFGSDRGDVAVVGVELREKRTRVVPYKYRDSVLEPALSRHESSVFPLKLKRRRR